MPKSKNSDRPCKGQNTHMKITYAYGFHPTLVGSHQHRCMSPRAQQQRNKKSTRGGGRYAPNRKLHSYMTRNRNAYEIADACGYNVMCFSLACYTFDENRPRTQQRRNIQINAWALCPRPKTQLEDETNRKHI